MTLSRNEGIRDSELPLTSFSMWTTFVFVHLLPFMVSCGCCFTKPVIFKSVVLTGVSGPTVMIAQTHQA